jgi:hypothetical protein
MTSAVRAHKKSARTDPSIGPTPLAFARCSVKELRYLERGRQHVPLTERIPAHADDEHVVRDALPAAVTACAAWIDAVPEAAIRPVVRGCQLDSSAIAGRLH